MTKCEHPECRSTDMCMECGKYVWSPEYEDSLCTEERLCVHGGNPDEPCYFVHRGECHDTLLDEAAKLLRAWLDGGMKVGTHSDTRDWLAEYDKQGK